MKKVWVSDRTKMVLQSLDNINRQHILYDSYYEKEVDDDFHVHVRDFAKVFHNAEVYHNAKVYSYARVCNNAKVYDDAEVYGNAKVYGNARVGNYARVFGFAEVFDNAVVCGQVTVLGRAEVFGYAKVYGSAEVRGNAGVYGNARVCNNTRVYGEAKVYGHAEVRGNAKVTKDTINIIGLTYNVTLTDRHIQIGCRQFLFEKAKKLAKRNADIDIHEYNTMIKHKDLLLALINGREHEQ